MRISKFPAPYTKLLFALAWTLLLSACASTPLGKPDQAAPAPVASLQAQLDRAEAALANTAGIERTLVFVGAALHSQSTAFQSDILAMQQRLGGFGMPMQSMMLSNPPKDQAALFAAATQQNLNEVFFRVGAWSNKYPLTVVVLISSHGNVDQLAINVADHAYPPIRSSVLDTWLRRINPSTPTAVLLSACHSGSFMPALRNGSRVVLTASAAERSSFGCSTKSTNTWFIESLLEQGMHPALSWSDSFARTAKRVDTKEKELKLVPSLPQASIPKAWADAPLSDWLRGQRP
jgi:hypothetical protein